MGSEMFAEFFASEIASPISGNYSSARLSQLFELEPGQLSPGHHAPVKTLDNKRTPLFLQIFPFCKICAPRCGNFCLGGNHRSITPPGGKHAPLSLDQSYERDEAAQAHFFQLENCFGRANKNLTKFKKCLKEPVLYSA